jgi:3-oxoacyl-[acyl-carrier protein] reductase
MDLGIAGKRAVVAASTSGLGLGTARALADAGCQVVVNGRDQARADEVAATLPNAVGVGGDLSSAAGAEAFIDAAADALGGGIDILITNNGGPPPGNFAETDISAYAQALELNLVAMAAMVKQVVPGMQAQQWGRIVAITSTSVHTPMPNLILSNTARSGLTSLLKTLALEVVGDGITVNTVQPGLHLTPRVTDLYTGDVGDLAAAQPTGRVGDADDFGAVCAFLCSEQANYVTGVSIPVDGGRFTQLQ